MLGMVNGLSWHNLAPVYNAWPQVLWEVACFLCALACTRVVVGCTPVCLAAMARPVKPWPFEDVLRVLIGLGRTMMAANALG